MEIKVGILHINREVTVESSSTADEVTSALREAIESGGLLTLEDSNHRTVVIPAASIGYVELGHENPRRVGFGNV